MPPVPAQPLRGIAFKVTSVCVFVAMASLIKATADHVPPGEAVFFRCFFAIPVIIVWLIWRGELRDGLKTANPMAHLWRGLIGTMGMGLGFAGLGLLPLPEVTAIGYTSSLFVVIFAAMFLNERVRLVRRLCGNSADTGSGCSFCRSYSFWPGVFILAVSSVCGANSCHL